MCGRTGSKYTFPFYIRPRFNSTTINPLKSSGLGKILHVSTASADMLHMLPLFLENLPFPCIIAIFLTKFSWKLILFLFPQNPLTHLV